MTDTKIRVFISSPGDVAAERARTQRVVDRVSGLYRGIDIECYRWEEGKYYSAHDSFQPQIEDIGGFDLVVGIIWSRLGSPLPSNFPTMTDGRPYLSGTAFEILSAMQHRRSGAERPDIFVYRKIAPPQIPVLDAEARAARIHALEEIDGFISEWFVNERDGFMAAFHNFETADDFESQFEKQLISWLRANHVTGTARRWNPAERGAPFVGLRAFDARHSEVFFGRAREIEHGRERLIDATSRGAGFLLVDGASGSGKSSFARAGLLPRFLAKDVDLRGLTVTGDTTGPLLERLCEPLFGDGVLPELRDSDFPTPEALADYLSGGHGLSPILRALQRQGLAVQEREDRDEAPDVRLLILLDQFEACLSQPDAQTGPFLACVDALARSGKAMVIATLRADARVAALRNGDLAALIDAGASLTLRAPDDTGLAEIVRGPAEAAGLAFETRDGVPLDDRLIADARGADALPLLQYALEQLYLVGAADANDDVTLSHADYDALGGLDGAIGKQADAAYSRVSDEARRSLPKLVRALAVLTGTGPDLRVTAASTMSTDAATAELISALTDARILVQDGDTLRFAHARVLTAWPRASDILADATVFLRVREDVGQAEARWRDEGERPDLLLPAGLRLAEADSVLASYADELSEPVQRFIRISGRRARVRQRLLAASAAVFAAVAVVAGLFYFQAREARNEARDFAQIAGDATGTLAFDIAGTLQRTRGVSMATLRSILDRTDVALDALIEKEPDEPSHRQTKASILLRYAQIFRDTGELDEALKQVVASEDLARALHVGEPENSIRQSNLVAALRLRFEILERMGKGDPALLDEAEALITRAMTGDPENDQAAIEMVRTRLDQVDIALRKREIEKAKGYLSQADDIVKTLIARTPTRETPFHLRMQIHMAMAQALVLSGDRKEASRARNEAIRLGRTLAKGDPSNTVYGRDLAVVLLAQGVTALEEGQSQSARLYFMQSVEYRRAVVVLDPDNLSYARDLSLGLERLGDLEETLGNKTAARAMFEEAVEITSGIAATDPDNAGYARDFQLARERLSPYLGPAEQRAILADGLALARSRQADDPEARDRKRDLVIALVDVGDTMKGIDDRASALAHYQEALSLAETFATPTEPDADALATLGLVLNRLGDMANEDGNDVAAEDAFTRMAAVLTTAQELDPGNLKMARDLSLALDRLSWIAEGRGDMERALTLSEDSLRYDRAHFEADPLQVKYREDLELTLLRTARLRRVAGQLDASEAAYTEGLAFSLERVGPDSPVEDRRRVAINLNILGDFLAERRQYSDAEARYRASLDRVEALARDVPANELYAFDTWYTQNRLAALAQRKGDREAALTWRQATIETYRHAMEAWPGRLDFVRQLAIDLNILGDLRALGGDTVGARAAYSESLALIEAESALWQDKALLEADLTYTRAKIDSVQ